MASSTVTVDAEGDAKGIQSTSEVVSLTLDQYNFKNKRRGRCIIINNHHFNKMLTNQGDRDGTDVDAEACESTFLSLGFDVLRYNDLSTTDMSIYLRKAAEEDHSDADCFACVILSHGEDGVIYGINGTVKIDSLLKNFKGDVCPGLAGKPKLFFLQACRGRRYDFGTELPEDAVDAAAEPDVRRIPVEADFLIAYSVVPGHFSWRNNVDGSWFVQALTRVFREYGDSMELSHMMTLVNRIVAFDFQSNTDDDFTSFKKQVPCIVSMLTRLVYFKPKY